MIKNFKKTILAAFLFALVLFSGVSLANTVTIEADEQDFQVNDSTAHFNGNVKVTYGDIKIASPTAILTSDEYGDPEKAVFSDGAIVTKKNVDGSDDLNADSVTLLLSSNQMIAQGNVNTYVKKNTPGAITIKADRQEFNNETNQMKASGNIVITYKGMKISGSDAELVNSQTGKPLKAMITGGARVIRDASTINAGSILLDLPTNNVTAQGGVRTSTVLQGTGRVYMTSNYQHYNKSKNIIEARGNVKVVYQDYTATGPRALFYLSGRNKINEIIFTGRSTIREMARKVIADKITVSFDPKNFKAEGNVKTQFVQKRPVKKDLKGKKNKSKKKKKVEKKKPETKPTVAPTPVPTRVKVEVETKQEEIKLDTSEIKSDKIENESKPAESKNEE